MSVVEMGEELQFYWRLRLGMGSENEYPYMQQRLT